MPAERWKQLWRLFDEALALPPGERRRFLEDQAEEDPALGSELQSLLEAHERQHTVLDRPPLGSSPRRSGEYIGVWRLVEEIGTGGMGVVWLAERADGAYEQQAALKLVAPGWASPGLTARFHRERQILARLRHPNIAALLDGGATADGQPFLVMEYVDGSPLTDHIRSRGLSVDALLALFVRICDAVSHAHQHLVLHRDLKPANILVAKDGSPKLLDFGIARLLDPDTDEPETRSAERRLTPEYASPEYLRGDSVDTGSDCFSLGVILYELLTGARPWRVEGLNARQALELVESQPASPLSRLALDSGNARLAARLRGDLDRIASKAVHPDRERRYANVRDLAHDIHCHRLGLPVSARADTWRYRAGKFLGRHRAAVGLSALGGALLVALTVALGLESARLSDALMHAQRQTERAEALSGFLTDLFMEADPEHHAGSPLTVRALLDQGTARLRDSFADQPALKAALLTSLGRIHTHLGEFDRAESLLGEAADIGGAATDADTALVTQTELALAQLLQQTGRHDEAESSARRALALVEADPDADAQLRLRGLLVLATALQFQGKLDAAEKTMRVLASLDVVPKGALAGEIALRRGALAWSRGEFASAHRHYREAGRRFAGHFGEKHPKVARAQNAVAATLYRLGRFDDAESAYRETLRVRRAVYGDEHPRTAETLAHLGALLYDRGETAASVDLLQRALGLLRDAHGPESPKLTNILNNLGLALGEHGRFQEAAGHFQDALRINRAAADNPEAAIAGNLSNLGLLRVEQRNYSRARELLQEALAIQTSLYPGGHVATAFTLNHLGRAALGLGRLERARDYFQRALAMRQRLLDGGHPQIADSLYWSGRLSLRSGDPARALEMLRRAVRIRRESLGASDPRSQEAAGYMGVALIGAGDAERGRSLAESSIRELAQHPRRQGPLKEALARAR